MAVKCDLERMSPKILSPVEQGIFENEASLIEQLLCSQLNHQERSLYTQIQADNQYIDRLTQADLVRVFLSRPDSEQIIKALHQGSSVPGL